MAHQIEVPKGEMWLLLGDKAIPFALWMNDTTNPYAVAVFTIFSSLRDIALESDVFQSILQLLLAESVITQAEIDRIAARIVELHKTPCYGEEGEPEPYHDPSLHAN